VSATTDLRPIDLERFTLMSRDLLAIATTERLVWVSPRWTEVLGWTAEELLAQPYIAFVHPDDVARTADEASRIAEGRFASRFRNRYRTKHGDFRWLEWTSVSGPDDLLYCMCRDVSRCLEAERGLAQRDEMIEMATQLVDAGHWSLDLLRDTLEWSPEVFALFGRDATGFTPSLERYLAACHRDDRDQVAECFDLAMRCGERFELESRIVRPTGEIRLVHCVGTPQRDASQRITGILGVVRDITDDDRVRRDGDLLQFAHVASHDLRQPVRTIRQYLGILSEDYDLGLDAEGQRYWGFVKSAADRLERLVRDLGRYTRAGQAPVPVPLDLDDLLADVVAELGPRFEAAGGHIAVHGRLPRVLGEASALGETFEHLLDNALQFAGDQPPRVTINTVAAPRSGTATILVSDQGLGFEPGDCEKIFEPFRRLGPHDVHRTGIGLAIVRRVVQSLAGQVWAQGQPGSGATFFLRLPLAPSPARSYAPAPRRD